MVSSEVEGPRRASPAPGTLGMEESVVRPSVFVVDGQTDIPFTRLGRSRRRQTCSVARVGLGLLLLLMGAGLAIQGWFLLQLHWRLGEMVTRLPVSGTGGLTVGGGEGGSPVSLWVTVCLCVCVCAGHGTD